MIAAIIITEVRRAEQEERILREYEALDQAITDALAEYRAHGAFDVCSSSEQEESS